MEDIFLQCSLERDEILQTIKDGEYHAQQTPTASHIAQYQNSKGAEACELYAKCGKTPLPWQRLLMEDILATNATDKLEWTHMKFGYSVPRRNGKSEILVMRAVYALVKGERVLYTAHRTTTSHNSWEKVVDTLAKIGYTEKDDYKTTKQFGLEHIEWKHGNGIINFRTRSSKGGLGEGYDLLIIDEAQEYTADQESALKYIVTDSKNPQTLMCGTPPTVVSSGTVFEKYRRECLGGKLQDAGWAEWSMPDLTDAHNIEYWYKTNPSLGFILSERTIRSELGDDQLDDNIQRLGVWVKYNQQSAITRNEWKMSIEKNPIPAEKPIRLFWGVKYAKHTEHVSLSVAIKIQDNKIFTECIDCRPVRDGNAWLMPYLQNPHSEKIIIDGAGQASILEQDIKEAGIKLKTVIPRTGEVIEAAAVFENLLFQGNLKHGDQPSLEQIAANCTHRPIGASGGFGYDSLLLNADISILESCMLASWLCATAKPKKKQLAFY